MHPRYCLQRSRHTLCVKLSKLHFVTERGQFALGDSKHLCANVVRNDRSTWDSFVRQQSSDNVSCACGSVQQRCPMFTRDQLCHAALPQSVDAEAKNIAQEVVSHRDATKYVIVLPREVSGIVHCCVGSRAHRGT